METAVGRAIVAVGGVVATPYKLSVSTTTVFTWRQRGAVKYTAHAVRLQRAAAAAGVALSCAELAGLPPLPGDALPDLKKQPKPEREQHQAS